MEETKVAPAPAKRGKGRPATGHTTIMIRIPIALKESVEQLKIEYRKVRDRHYRWLTNRQDGIKQRCIIQRRSVFCNCFRQQKARWSKAGFKLIDHPLSANSGKNSCGTRIKIIMVHTSVNCNTLCVRVPCRQIGVLSDSSQIWLPTYSKSAFAPYRAVLADCGAI